MYTFLQTLIIVMGIYLFVIAASEHIATTFAIVGRFFMAGLFSMIFVYTTELYPTVIRCVCMYVCVCVCGVCGVCVCCVRVCVVCGCVCVCGVCVLCVCV